MTRRGAGTGAIPFDNSLQIDHENPVSVNTNLGTIIADHTSQKEFEVTSLTYCVFSVWLQADLLAVSFWSLAVQHNLLCNVHVEAVALPRFMRSLH